MGDHSFAVSAMWARCMKLLTELDVRPPVALQDLVDAVARRQGRPITLVPADLPTDKMFGLTGSDEHGDIVLFQRRTSIAHQLLIVLHELAHILAGHRRHTVKSTDAGLQAASNELSALPESLRHLVLGTGPASTTPTSEALTAARPTLLDELREAAHRGDTDAVARKVDPNELHGALYDDPDEWEAETMATWMLDWVQGANLGPLSPSAQRLRATLGEPGGSEPGGA